MVVIGTASTKPMDPTKVLTISCEIDALLALRAQINNRSDAAFKVSVNDFVIKSFDFDSDSLFEFFVFFFLWHRNNELVYKFLFKINTVCPPSLSRRRARVITL